MKGAVVVIVVPLIDDDDGGDGVEVGGPGILNEMRVFGADLVAAGGGGGVDNRGSESRLGVCGCGGGSGGVEEV